MEPRKAPIRARKEFEAGNRGKLRHREHGNGSTLNA